MRNASLAVLLLLAAPAFAQSQTPAEVARRVAGILEEDDPAGALEVLAGQSDVDRFQTLRILDRKDETDVRKIYDSLDASGRAQLLALTKSAGDAGKKAGLMQTGIVSDNDDTAFPTEYTPDGPFAYKGSAKFYHDVGLGTDGKGDPANIHYVSARLPIFFPDSRERLEAAGLPNGTFDGDKDPVRFATGGLDGIEQSKIENMDLWLKLHPGQKFVFLGDTLQRDPEVYRWVQQHYPDQVEAVFIHKAGGPARAAEDYKGQIFFDDYIQAYKTATDLGIPQPGARQPDHSADPKSVPNTDVTPENKINSKVGFFAKVKNFVVENIGALFHHEKKPAASDPRFSDPRGFGMTNLLDQRLGESTSSDRAAAEK